ncbi:MAG: MBL fold metallo-hydrolase [Myxococcota bacterium]|nr:MBL fold metallo-hydrolase [Myxococcota bacterium]MEC8423216.1 MBL fold metallo-hydrolase [Myxococcota bacterium]
MRPLVLLVSALGCADITPLEDGARYGPVTVVQDWFTSFSVIRTGTGTVLVDAGFREQTVTEGLAGHGIDAASIDTVLLTHAHGDHVSGRAAVPQAELWGIGSEAELLGESTDGATLDRALTAGEVLAFGGTRVEVLSVPGHTRGSAAYLVDGVLLLGDACLVDGDGRVALVPEKRSEDPHQAAVSLAGLARQLEARGVRVDWLVPSHSGAARGLGPLLDFASRVEAGDAG